MRPVLQECQAKHWPSHKALCKTLRNQARGESGKEIGQGDLNYKALFREVLQVTFLSLELVMQLLLAQFDLSIHSPHLCSMAPALSPVQ